MFKLRFEHAVLTALEDMAREHGNECWQRVDGLLCESVVLATYPQSFRPVRFWLLQTRGLIERKYVPATTRFNSSLPWYRITKKGIAKLKQWNALAKQLRLTNEWSVQDPDPEDTKEAGCAIIAGDVVLARNLTRQQAARLVKAHNDALRHVVRLPASYQAVPREPREAQWNGLARQIVFWWSFTRPTGRKLYDHLRSSGWGIPEWLQREIENNDHIPPKGTVAACIYKAMLEAAAGRGRHPTRND